MTRIHRQSQAFRFGRTFGAPLGIAALAATVGCGARDANAVAAQSAPQPIAVAQPQPAGAPMIVSCEPTQRTLVRPVVVNGAAMSQVECVSSGVTAVPQGFAPVPQQVAYAPAPQPQVVEYRPARASAPAYDDLGDARVVTAPAPSPRAAVVPARQVVYRDEVPLRKKRTVAKSAVIIGSTAGAGAGIGALIGGKKGALIGAAVGGGGATLWDQVTRRKN